ncbi:MAG: Histidine kinase, gyrase and HSP90-like ATPase [Massilia sp.]|jgi:signal transduction histidine kinase|nr:Histidine kinase, gyrase and HSP90-like ATPase [Massilia sp.]
MRASTQFHMASLRSIVLLTILSVIFLSAMITAGFFGIPHAYLPANMRPLEAGDVGLFKLASLAVCPIGYAWLITNLAGKQARRRDTLRYALKLQLQAVFEVLAFGLTVCTVLVIVHLLTAEMGAAAKWSYLIDYVESDGAKVAAYATALSLLPLSMLIASWRMHGLSRTPAALAAAVNGSLFHKAVRFHTDTDAVRNELARQLERLTGAGTPGLGRIMYGSHPKLTSREIDGEVVHALAWFSCPTKLLVSCRPQADGSQQVQVSCTLRSGLYGMYLLQTPLDAAAQMQYIDAHLLRPLAAQLAKLSAEQQRDTQRDMAVATQLRILQAQIEPHFLFNTLANVRQLYRTSVADGESMMDHLIVYLRYAMDDLRAETSSVVKEMNLVMHFLSIMKIRMGERLSYQFSIAESLLEHPFPPAMLISLVENAIRHGLVDCEHGAITMSAGRDGDLLRVTIADNGAGFSSVGGSGLGLSNIRQRLETMHGTRAWLEVGAPASGGFTATIVIPFQERNC